MNGQEHATPKTFLFPASEIEASIANILVGTEQPPSNSGDSGSLFHFISFYCNSIDPTGVKPSDIEHVIHI
jgi:hypothetical protein